MDVKTTEKEEVAIFPSAAIENNNVELRSEVLGHLIGLLSTNYKNESIDYELAIPDYQRIYSWQEKIVIRLLDDILNYGHKKYHMGSIILHKTKKKAENGNDEIVYDIVDGQQRLVTLSLLLLQLGKNNFSLLNESFESPQAHNYIAHNKWIIENYIKKLTSIQFNMDKILSNLNFSVLILHSDNLDLAYTFFGNENSKGKPLSDYDLLKSHHLRFIHIPEQAEHLAERWDNLIRNSNNDDLSHELGRTFEVYLFRLRKWMRKRNWNDNGVKKVKNEFEAAPVIPYIPPFGEQFKYNESIQGGTHFFAFAEHFIHHFKEFRETEPYKNLNKHLNWEKHWWYRDVMEALIFAYYLKFGKLYLNRGSMLIIQVVSLHRYKTSRAYLSSIFDYVANSEIILMIDQATSPTFFLAEMEQMLKASPVKEKYKGTRGRYFSHIEKIQNVLEDK